MRRPALVARRSRPALALSLAVAASVALGGCKKHAATSPPPADAAAATATACATDEEPLAPLPSLVAEKDPEPVFPYLDDEDQNACRSIGETSHGRVVRAVPIEETESLGILPRQKLRDLAYGSSGMAKLLARAGDAVFAATKTKLFIGDVGKKGGGHIAWSVSHNAGRDADVAFSYLDAATKQRVDAPDLVPLGKDGVSKDGSLCLDAERTWITVRALVTSPDAEVEYVFISEPLKKKLLLWARDHKEKPDVIERAANLLHQPGGAAPHDDHLHVRIYCGALDVASGCVDTGTPAEGRATFASAREERIRRAVEATASTDAGTRVRAVLRLGVLKAERELPRTCALLGDDSPEVRHAAATVVGALGAEANVPSLAKRFEVEADGRVRLRLLESALALGGRDATALLTKVIATPAPAPATPFADPPAKLDLLDGASVSLGVAPLVEPATLRSIAVVDAGRARALDAVPALVALLDDDDHVLRVEAAESLALVTNVDPGGGAFDDDAAKDAHARAKKAYEDLWKKLGRSPRDVWLGEGFRRAGFQVRAFDRTGVWELVRASATGGFVGVNAREVLARIAGEPELAWGASASEACTYYLDYFKARKPRFRLSDPPDAVARACAASKRT